MERFLLLRRFANTHLPTSVSTLEDIEMTRQLKDDGFLLAAIPKPSKGRDNYGEQGPALVLQITSAGLKLLASDLAVTAKNRTSAPKS